MTSELLEASIEAFAKKRGSSAKRAPDKKYTSMKERRKAQMVRLKNGLDLKIFMISIGTMTFHGDGRIKAVHERKEQMNSEKSMSQTLSDNFDESLNLTAFREEKNAKRDDIKASSVPLFSSSILVNSRKDSSKPLLTLDQGYGLASTVLHELGYQTSQSQKETPKDGNISLFFYQNL